MHRVPLLLFQGVALRVLKAKLCVYDCESRHVEGARLLPKIKIANLIWGATFVLVLEKGRHYIVIPPEPIPTRRFHLQASLRWPIFMPMYTKVGARRKHIFFDV